MNITVQSVVVQSLNGMRTLLSSSDVLRLPMVLDELCINAVLGVGLAAFSLLRADGKHLCLKSLLIPKLPSYQEGLAVSKYCDISKVNVMGEALNLDKRDCFETK